MITLRKKIEESKAWYLQRYGVLDWQWEDEGLPYAIMDYHSSVGSTLDFSEDDWKACEENGWSKAEKHSGVRRCENRELQGQCP